MIKEIGSYEFIGFYETIFSNSDEFIDEEVELKSELEVKCQDNCIDINTDDIEVNMEYTDYNKYKLDVCRKFMELYVDEVIYALPSDITDKKFFKFEIVDDSIEVVSPKFYNYSTDRCYCNVETNYETLDLIKNYTLGLNGVEAYIRKHFTSRDGFVSFISNDLEYWKDLSIKEYEENMLISLLDMLLILSNKNIFDSINYSVYDCVCKYEYAEPFVYYNGFEKGYYDFCKELGIE